MRILLCDDNPDILVQLQKYIQDYFKELGHLQPELAVYTNGDELLSSESYADIAFLDVEMPGRSGIHVGAKLQEINPRIMIFIVTSYPDYLDEAMRFHVFRYLSKPIDKNRLYRNLKDSVFQYSSLTKMVTINTTGGLVTVHAEQIMCVEAVQRRCMIRTTDEDYMSTDGIEFWRKSLLLPSFYSTYRSFIVNMQYVSQVKKDTVILKHGEKSIAAYLARRKYTAFKDQYLLYLESMR